MPTLSRLALVAMITSVLLAACASHPVTRPSSTTKPASSLTAARKERGTGHAAAEHPGAAARTGDQASDADAGRTGIPACDDYLSSYMACHRAAAIYAPEQLPYRYQAMRTSLLRDAKNPEIRPQLEERCNSLARSLRQALHGKSCEENPAPADSAP